MQRAIIALSVASREGSMSTAPPYLLSIAVHKDIYQLTTLKIFTDTTTFSNVHSYALWLCNGHFPIEALVMAAGALELRSLDRKNHRASGHSLLGSF
jgi:hypothetical protein